MNRHTICNSLYRPVLFFIVITRRVWYGSPSINSNPHIWNGRKSDNKLHNMVGLMSQELLTVSSIQWLSSCCSIVWIHDAPSFPCPSLLETCHICSRQLGSLLRNLVAFCLLYSPVFSVVSLLLRLQDHQAKNKISVLIAYQFNTCASRISATGVKITVSMYAVGVFSRVFVYAKIRAVGFALIMAFRNVQLIPCWKRNQDSSQLFHLLHVEGPKASMPISIKVPIAQYMLG